MCRFASAFGVTVFVLSVSGCQPAANSPAGPSLPAPIAVGELLSVTAYPKPIQQLSEEGFKEHRGGRVEVYDHFILVTDPGGQKTVIPHGWYKQLEFK